MLVITITDGDTSGKLKFRVNGSPSSNGNGEAKKNWKVQWMVQPHSNVSHIESIEMKPAPNNTNIFTADPPSPQGTKKHWQATVDSHVTNDAKYIYLIKWKHIFIDQPITH